MYPPRLWNRSCGDAWCKNSGGSPNDRPTYLLRHHKILIKFGRNSDKHQAKFVSETLLDPTNHHLTELGGDPPPLGDVLADDLDNIAVSRLPLH